MKSCPPRASPLDERSSLFDDVAFGIRTEEEEEEEEEEDINNKSSCVVLDTPFLLGGVLLLLLLLLRDAAAEEEKEEGGEGKQEQQQFIIRARLGFRPSVCVRLCPSVSVCVCVLLFFEAKSAVFLFFFLLVPHTKNKITHPHIIDCASLLLNNIFTLLAINQSISSIHSFYTHTHSLST
jgi:hypothetical protein